MGGDDHFVGDLEARLWARAPREATIELTRLSDRVAEVQNTLRSGTPVTMARVEAAAVWR